MKLSEVITPVSINQEEYLLDLIRSSTSSEMSSAYDLVDEIRKDSSINDSAYLIPPKRLYGKDLSYIIKTITLLTDQYKEEQFPTDSQILRLLDECNRYLNNQH